MWFRILGPLTVAHESLDLTPTAPKVRQVLSLLLVSRNRAVQVHEFITELWGGDPPDSSLTTLQTYIYKLRRDVFDPYRLGQLHTKASGYLLETAGEDVDAYRFERIAQQGRAAYESGDPLRASE